MQVVSSKEYITVQERKMLLQKNDWLAIYEVLSHWLWIAFAFFIAYYWTNPFTIIVALFILGGKQLGCAILMHDTSHRSLFKNAKLETFIGQWFGAYPIFHDMERFRPYHLTHHINTGLVDIDPDTPLTKGYPTTKMSMTRKFIRDLVGITGVKMLIGMFMMHLGYLEYDLGGAPKRVSQKGRSFLDVLNSFRKNLLKPLLANAILFGILWFAADWWLYLLWIGAFITTFNFSARVRSMAEHAMVEDTQNPIKNTRTTYANIVEKVLFAPYNVNYHVEHHMLMGVPCYRLPQMHKILLEKGFYEKGVLEPNYWRIIARAVPNNFKP